MHAGACRQHQQSAPHTGQAAEAQQAGGDQQHVSPLLEMYPNSSLAYLNHVLHDICHDGLEVCGLASAPSHLPCCIFLLVQAGCGTWYASITTTSSYHVTCPLAYVLEMHEKSKPKYYIMSISQDAVHWLMDQDNLERSEGSWYARQEQLQRDAEQAARQEKANRKKLLEKYHLQAVPTSARTDVHTRSMQATKPKVLGFCYCHDNCLTIRCVLHVR